MDSLKDDVRNAPTWFFLSSKTIEEITDDDRNADPI
jgi:hypothetical protein